MTENVNVNAQIDRPGIIPPPYTGQGWEDMLDGAHVVQGSDQEKGNALIGVPFVLVQITIQPGDYRHGKFKEDGKNGPKILIPDTGCGVEHPYVYLTAIIGPPKAWDKAVKRGKVSDEAKEMFDPGDSIGFPEGGTGIYREVLSYLEDNGRLILPHDGPAGGAFGESRFDFSGEQIGECIADGERIEMHFSDGSGKSRVGSPVYRYTWDVRLVCPRGLRASEYQNDYTKEGRTRYFG